MLKRIRLWMLGTISLIGVSLAGYAYALSCGIPLDSYDLQLISVTYDGVPQSNPSYYNSAVGVLFVTLNPWPSFLFRIEKQPDAQVLEYGHYEMR